MFFDAAYCDEDALTITDPADNVTASSLLLLPYAMTFHGQRIGLAYVYGAGTLRKYRARGFMSRLMKMAVAEASERGDTFIGLIPASDSLRRYYARFGFATVGFSRPERYTAAHKFMLSDDFVEAAQDPLQLYADFGRLMAMRPCCVQHSCTQFLTVMDDCRISGGFFAAAADAASGRVVSMVWGRPETASDVVRVTELLAESPAAADAALALLRRKCPNRPFTLMTQPADSEIGGAYMAGAMLRVVRPDSALAVIAASHPELKLSIRLNDQLIPENSGVYLIANGSVEQVDDYAGVPDLDVSPAVLTALMFGSEPVADVTGLPAMRPRISLMLD